MAGLITLEPAGVNDTNASPASLPRAAAEQAAQFTHIEFLFLPTDRGVIRRFIKANLVNNRYHIVEIGFRSVEALIDFNLQKDDCNLDPLGAPAVAVRRSEFIRLVNALFDKI